MLSRFKTLENIQASFNGLVDDLKNLRERNKDVIDKNVVQITRMETRNSELTAESDKAMRFQTNLENLMK